MTIPPALTDRLALSRIRQRASRAPALFLHEAAIAEIKDRLSLVNKSFTATAIVTGCPEIWQRAFPDALCVDDAERLDLNKDVHDLVIHAMCLHWANDPVGQMIQCRHALKPDGLFLCAMFGGETLHQLRASLAQAESDLTGGLSARIAPMAEIRDLGGLLQRAGLALPVADSLPFNVSYTSAFHLMRDLRAMGETSAMNARPRRFTRRSVLEKAATIYAENFSEPENRVSATFDLIFLAGWAPDASQPKPLRPGSAAARLSDVLGTDETPLKD